MLEQMRKQGASIFVYLIFCLLIAIFVINFRPGQSRQGDNGCRGTSNVVLSVDGTEATQTAFKIAYSNPYNRGNGKNKTYVAMETLIRRELLASAGDERGLIVTDDLVMDEIKKGRYFIGGQRTQIPGIFFETGDWNLKAFNNWVGQLNVSRNAYIEEQRRSMLASMMAEILMESVQVSRDEALHKFMTEGNTVTYDVVAFKPETYRAALRLSDADVDRFLATHADEVQARFKADERTYKGVKPQLKLRQIFIAKAEAPEAPKAPEDKKDEKKDEPTPADPKKDEKAAADQKKSEDKKADDKKDDKKVADKKADKKAGDKAEPKKPVGMPIDEAKKKLEAVRTAAAGNKQKFVDAAKELSTDEAAKNEAGDLGWHQIENPMLGDKAVNDAVKALKPGEMTPVIVTDRGAYLVMAEDKREGDLTFDQVKHEIAKELAKDVWSKEAAKRAALAALDQAQHGVGMNLDQLYEKDKVPEQQPGGFDIQQILDDPSIPEDQKQKIREMIEKQKHGALEVPEKDIPAGWFEDGEDTAKGSAAGSAAPAKGSAATPPAAGSAAKGSAATPAAAGSGAGSAAPTTGAPATPPAPAGDPLAPSKDQLPPLSDLAKAHVNRYSGLSRAKQMPGLGSSKEAIAAVFEELQPGNLAKHIYEADGSYIVIQLIARSQANVTDFDKDADRRIAELRSMRAQAFLDDWMKTKCEMLAKDGKIKPNQELLIEHDEQGKVLPIGYKPCMSFR